MSKNPYFAFIQLEIGGYSVNNVDDGHISLQASYQGEAYCEFVVEVYDDTAHKLAEKIADAGAGNMQITYGYVGGQLGQKGLNCSITNIHTELTGQGEILTIEMVPEALEYVLNHGDEFHTADKKYTGSISSILRQVIGEIGWTEGTIVDTKPEVRGENNGNDDILAAIPEDYFYWRSDESVIDFMRNLCQYAISKDGKGDYIINVHYSNDDPVVDFYPSEDAPDGETYTFTFGNPNSEIISINVDWGIAIMQQIGATGSKVGNIDSIDNTPGGAEHTTGIPAEQAKSATNTDGGYNSNYNGSVLNKRNGRIQGPQGEETFYGTLKPGSKAFSYAANNVPGSSAWKQYYRSDGVLMWGEYVVVAADISGNYGAEPGYPALPNHKGRFERGDIVQTSLGKAIVVDACRAACDAPGAYFDIAVNW